MSRKIVFFTQRVEEIPSYKERRDCADQRISEFLWSAGCSPVPMPNKVHVLSELLKVITPGGLVLTGGNSPMRYGGNAPERDDVDKFLIDYAIRTKTPLYGFCRGMQSILDYHGNTLVPVQGHIAVKHKVHGIDGAMTVNSYHSLGCFHLECEDLISEMTCDDGVIEKIRHRELPIIGTMWHPERNAPFENNDVDMVKKLFTVEDFE